MGVTLKRESCEKLLCGDCHPLQKFQVMDIKSAGRETTFKDDGGVENKEWYKLLLRDASVFIEVGISDEVNEMVRSKQLRKGSVVQLKKFLWDRSYNSSTSIIINKLIVVSQSTSIPGRPKPFQVKTSIPSSSDEDPVDPDVNDDESEDEPTASKQKCSSSQSQSKKQKRQSSDLK